MWTGGIGRTLKELETILLALGYLQDSMNIAAKSSQKQKFNGDIGRTVVTQKFYCLLSFFYIV